MSQLGLNRKCRVELYTYIMLETNQHSEINTLDLVIVLVTLMVKSLYILKHIFQIFESLFICSPRLNLFDEKIQ